MSLIQVLALSEVQMLCIQHFGPQIVRRHVGWLESRSARHYNLEGKQRARFQRAFHRSLGEMK